ncbi:MAG: Ldh family oxidoreductase [Kiritimatiellia bacterium]|jgi:LDH2 family malate/lactate/ureidoglycolate dehydrogenase|nr:Ldh family oxidoreductase [Kiritimatiellia bacterium]
MNDTYVRIEYEALLGFCRRVFEKLGLSNEDAAIASDVLVASDVRGIESHGVGRLWRYRNGLKTGLMLPDAETEVLKDTPSSVVLNANGGMGAPVSVKAMNTVVEKADANGSAFGCVRDSNHFGIAGYYAMLALEKDMLGFAMTNTAALGVPTFGRQVAYGTNPLAFCAPADREKAFVLDMSTTVVTRGKVELYDNKGKGLPLGWAVDKTGRSAENPKTILDDMFNRIGGGILPLGGEGEGFGGHKGYGLAVMVDILCAVLGGAAFGTDICDTETSSARVSHFFGAIKIDRFRDPADFRKDMDIMLERLRRSSPAEGCERVYFAGQKEFEKEAECMTEGVPLLKHTYDELCWITSEEDLEAPAASS